MNIRLQKNKREKRDEVLHIVLILLVIILVVAAVYFFVFVDKEQNKEPEVVTTEETKEGEIDTSDWEIYKNEEHGFSLKFPREWKGYIHKKRIIYWGKDIGDSIDFGFSEQDSLFNISIHNKDLWQEIQSEDQPKPMYLGENGEYVFGYSQAHDAINERIAKRMEEVSLIVYTFSLFLTK